MLKLTLVQNRASWLDLPKASVVPLKSVWVPEKRPLQELLSCFPSVATMGTIWLFDHASPFHYLRLEWKLQACKAEHHTALASS